MQTVVLVLLLISGDALVATDQVNTPRACQTAAHERGRHLEIKSAHCIALKDLPVLIQRLHQQQLAGDPLASLQ